MTCTQIQRALYPLAFLAILMLMVSIHNNYYVHYFMFKTFRLEPMLFFKQVLFFIYLLTLIVAPFIKFNKVLFLVPIDALLNSFNFLPDLYHSFIAQTVTFASFGSVPGYLGPIILLAVDIYGLILLALRLYKYIQEKKLDKASRF